MKRIKKDLNPLRLKSPFVYKDTFIITYFSDFEKRCNYG